MDMEGHDNNLPDSELVTFYPFSMDNAAELKDRLAESDCDTFYHFAWAGSAGADRADTALQLKNAQWTVDCLRLAKDLGCSRFVNAGSIMELETMKAVFTAENKPGGGLYLRKREVSGTCNV